MEIRTYGVEGFMDWQCEIHAGKVRATVHFTGGGITAYGVTPAEYSTGNPVFQRIIENSSHFKNGRICLLRKIGTPDPVKPKAPKPKPVEMSNGITLEASNGALDIKSTPKEEPVEKAEEGTSDNVEEPGTEEVQDSPVVADSPDDEEPALLPVAVSCLPDAQNYLRENFGIPTSKSRSKEKAQTFGSENGIVFVGLD